MGYSDKDLISFLEEMDGIGLLNKPEQDFVFSILEQHYSSNVKISPGQRETIEGSNGLMVKYMRF